jgi:tetratricopeptide (TPR) repeat protein
LGLVGAVAVVIAAGSLAVALPPLRARLATAFSGQEHAFRVLTWEGTMRVAAAYPALGSGPGTFEYIFPKYAIAGFTRMAHQNYLQVLAENGPAGLAAFLWLMAAAVIMSARALRRGELTDRLTAAACLAGLASFIAHGFIDYTWFVGGIATSVWLLAGIGAGLSAAPGEGMILTFRRKSRILVAVAAVVVAVALVFLPVAAAVAEQDALSGVQALRAGDRLRAEADLRAAAAWAPLDGNYWRLLGAAVGGDDGLRYMRTAMTLQPTSPMARAWLARLLLYEGRLAAASKEFQAAIRLNPNYTSAWLDLAEIAMRQGSTGDAQRAYSAVVRIENSPYGRVRALEQRVDTDFALAHYGLGLLSLGMDKARADSEFERAINIILEYESTQEPLDRALESLGQADPARTGRIRGLKAKVLWRSAALAKEAGDLPKYERRRGKALQADPDVQAAIEREDAVVTHAGSLRLRSGQGSLRQQ